MNDLFRLLPGEAPEVLALFRELCRKYQASLPFSLCFQGFEEEMASLPGKYARPTGGLYVAVESPVGGVSGSAVRPLGCAAFRPLEEGVCELKRMYVVESARGKGIARAIATRLMNDARAAGYVQMKLDTSGDMLAAQSLYRSLGFRETERYNDDPMEDTLYFAAPLTETTLRVRTAGS